MNKREPFFWVTVSCGIVILAFILLPIIQMLLAPSIPMLKKTIMDKDVLRSIGLSIYTAGAAALISFLFGTPLAYLLARSNFKGKKIIEGIIDLPIVIPHPVVGIAILSIAGKGHWLGRIMTELGIHLMGSVAGIITVLTFVGIPLYIHTAKEGFENISPRMENISRSLGAGMFSTFFRITFPLARRSMLAGAIMACARAISEFGAVIIIAYHPMIAPVMIYDRFQTMGLKYSLPVAVWLVLVCLVLFFILRTLNLRMKRKR